MYGLFIFVLFIGVIVVQTTVLHSMTIAGVMPDLILLFVVYLGLIRGSNVGCACGFFFGLIEDVYSARYLGSNALTKTIIGFFCGVMGKRIYTQSLFAQMLCVAIGTVVDTLLLLGIHGFIVDWKRLILYKTIYNTVCCPFFVALISIGEKRFGAKASSYNDV